MKLFVCVCFPHLYQAILASYPLSRNWILASYSLSRQLSFIAQLVPIVLSTRKRLTNTILNVDNEKIPESNSVKYLGVINDSKLKFDGEVTIVRHRMACGIKVLKTISKSLPVKTKISLLNAIAISHLHHSALILIGFQNSLLKTSDKQLDWGIKTIFNRRKYDRSTDLKLRNKILPVSFPMKFHCSKFFFRLISNNFPA